MPRYDFECKRCGHHFEASLSLKELEGNSDKKICPECHSNEIQQKFTTGGIVKGKGDTVPPCGRGMCGGGGCSFAS